MYKENMRAILTTKTKLYFPSLDKHTDLSWLFRAHSIPTSETVFSAFNSASYATPFIRKQEICPLIWVEYSNRAFNKTCLYKYDIGFELDFNLIFKSEKV